MVPVEVDGGGKGRGLNQEADEALPRRARERKGEGLTARATRAPAPPDAKRPPGWVFEE